MKKNIHKFRPIYSPIIEETKAFFESVPPFVYSVLHPYKYDQKRYVGSFLDRDVKISKVDVDRVTEVIYCFWTGDNEMSSTRKECLEQLKSKVGVPVKLITPQNLDGFILPKHPLHRAYKNLSCVHKADYLRCYFMHHHGGGYTDIKKHKHSWVDAFDKLNNFKFEMLGYPSTRLKDVAYINLNGDLKKDIKRHWRYTIGVGAFICRPYSSFTTEWYNELMVRMDYYADALEKTPGIDVCGKNKGYPIRWANILAEIFHPLCLKHNGRFLRCKSLFPICKNYR